MRLDQIMKVSVETIHPGATFSEAETAMRKAKIRHLVVVDRRRKIAGVLSVHDLRGADPDGAVETRMSAPAITLPETAAVQDAARLLSRHHIGCLPVIARGRVIGIVTASDLLALLGKGTLRIQPKTRKWTLAKRGPTHRPEPRRA